MEFESLGLVRIEPDGIVATALGRYFVRPLAMVFDRYLRQTPSGARYSRVL
jgi:oxygen-independent coproporphyrinogen-3 oxidase